ncbi:ATP-binding cassette domain-containing protein [Micromonospora sp. CP22]|uniref:ATP-binding cassette domain-containing protein n=1 Tax=Micromonospora sp. CP22 TaxID=2580517 RepID=UPI0012BBA070|nr:ATP-binding cassette domain-containing protein [Micromonospora sp. CP22]MTK00928.1 ATP-binding cassette domain-containing protein [Micromonospora sp. CP22]
MTRAIEAEQVGKRYAVKGGEVGLHDLSVQAEQGQVHALLGPNGAGKTTAVRGLATLLRFDRGTARVAGYDVGREAERVRERIGLVGQYAAVDERLTAVQNLRFLGRLRGLGRAASAARAEALIEQFGLVAAANRAVSGYSGGMRRRLDLAASLIVTPQVLFVDEPTTGLDPAARRDLWNALRELVRQGTTILLTTQYLEEADELADKIVLLARGKVVAEGSADDLKAMVGPPIVQIRFATDADADAALPALVRVDAGARLDSSGSTVTLPATAPEVLGRSVDALTGAGLAAIEVTLRKPTLDEVFLTLTGDEPATEEAA